MPDKCCFAGCQREQLGVISYTSHFSRCSEFLDYSSSPQMKSCCCSLAAELCPGAFHSSRQSLVRVVRVSSLAGVAHGCCPQCCAPLAFGKGKQELLRAQLFRA